MKTILVLVAIILSVFSFGQSNGQRDLTKFLRTNKIDTFLYVKSGCANCIISYEVTSKAPDTVSIWLLYQQKGRTYLISFSDTSEALHRGVVQTDIFFNVIRNENALNEKVKYYEQEKLLKFQAPCLASYPYESLFINIGHYKFQHTLVTRDGDDCGVQLGSAKWFQIEVDILKAIDSLKQATL